jgi:thiol-disulfide isomerase/thioredoxin
MIKELAAAQEKAKDAKLAADKVIADAKAANAKQQQPVAAAPAPAKTTTPTVQPAQMTPADNPNGVVFASAKAGMELNNDGNAMLLDQTITYKPGETLRFEGMLINENVPPFSFTDINGNEVRQTDLLGKVVYIDFWATWCAPCKEHIRYMQSQIEENKNNKDIVYLFISVDSDTNKWRNYVRENNLGGIQVHDALRLVSMYWNIQALPNYFLLGKDGRVAINSFIKSKKSLEDMMKYLFNTNYQGSGVKK